MSTHTGTATRKQITGRPPTPAETRLDNLVMTRLNPADGALVDAAAVRARITRSVILRAAANTETA